MNVQQIRDGLNITCTECGHSITPSEFVRTDSEHVRCPACGQEFVPAAKPHSLKGWERMRSMIEPQIRAAQSMVEIELSSET